jgi:hypothetical protein
MRASTSADDTVVPPSVVVVALGFFASAALANLNDAW